MSEHLYIHIPFCLKKCRYCDFFSVEDPGLIRGFVGALIREISIRSRDNSLPVKTIYFGGGTPSLLPISGLSKILNAIYRRYSVARDAEITLEANPGTVAGSYLKDLKYLGINRLSLGIQSFSSEKLAMLGRIHTVGQGVAAIEKARGAGFDNIGLDLIYGVPGESFEKVAAELEKALSFEPAHLSCYMLTMEEGTPFYEAYLKKDFHPMASEDQVALFSAVSGYLEDAGFLHYEVSNFAAAPSRISRHNTAYWQMVPYGGFGPSAHSLCLLPSGSPERSWNAADVELYVRRLEAGCLPVAEKETLTVSQQLAERVMVGLRTRSGVDVKGFDRLSSTPFQKRFPRLIVRIGEEKLGRMSADGDRFFLTPGGWACLDSIVEEFARDIL